MNIITNQFHFLFEVIVFYYLMFVVFVKEVHLYLKYLFHNLLIQYLNYLNDFHMIYQCYYMFLNLYYMCLIVHHNLLMILYNVFFYFRFY